MDQLQTQIIHIPRKGQIIHKPLKIDMTPLVDLGFLLISFFIFTTTISEKKTLSLIMPKEGPPIYIKESHALTTILGKNNKIYIYSGKWEDALRSHQFAVTDYNEFGGLGKLIRQIQNQLNKTNSKEDLMLLIKPLDHSTYKNLIDALDEANINNIKKYAIITPLKEETDYFKN